MFTFIHMNVSLSIRHMAVCALIVAMAALCNFDAFAQNTTLWLVRHAEKSTDNPANQDPALNAAGMQRAEALARLLDSKPIVTIYSTYYKRTLGTVAPLAAKLGLTPVIYNPDDIGGLAQKVVSDNKGKSALIVGHSNTIIPVIKALSASVPFD
jgi:2,3-bisphosphoglycerate-dependent phosphoglycerate mutase